MKDLQPQKRVNWRAVGFYYGVACALSWPFFWWRDIHPESWWSWKFPLVLQNSPLTFILKNAIVMWGPGIAAILSLIIFQKTHRRTITFWGSSAAKSLAFYWVPILFAVIVGMPMPDGSVNRLGTLALGLVTLFTILGEELGWRGFLQDALRPLSPLRRYVLIGVLWEFWHFTNRTAHGSLKHIVLFLAIFYPVGIILSCIIGEATERGKSLLIAVTLHAWFDIVFTFPGTRTYISLGLSILFWIFLLLRWNNNQVEAHNEPA
ncbi:MAG: protease family protein [Acidobacteriota bacterium]|nr:protease family protein [Acidobacteriota bacterium]